MTLLLPTLPPGWWIAYIYPMHHLGTWVVDARSITSRAEGEDPDLTWAISKAIAAIEAGEVTPEEREAKAAPAVTGLLAAIGLAPKPTVRRKVT
jgi:hypothetical protein